MNGSPMTCGFEANIGMARASSMTKTSSSSAAITCAPMAWSIDTSRHAREKLSPKDYARFSYYEQWIAALADLLAEAGLVTKAELSAGTASAAAPHPKLFTADKVAPALARGTPYTRASDIAPAFTPGDRVFHQKFGYGTVMGVEGDKLDIEFEKAGAKKVVAKFVSAADRAGDDVPF